MGSQCVSDGVCVYLRVTNCACVCVCLCTCVHACVIGVHLDESSSCVCARGNTDNKILVRMHISAGCVFGYACVKVCVCVCLCVCVCV